MKDKALRLVLEPALINFVRSFIPSIWALELLLMLRRAAPQYLTTEELVQLLRATPTLIDRLLADFVAAGLAFQNGSGSFRFECASPEKEALCEALAAAAEERPLALRDVIVSAPNSRLRDLADAFRFPNKTPKEDPDR